MTNAAHRSNGLSPMEQLAVRALRTASTPCSVHAVMPVFPGRAYTTVATVLFRLYARGVIERVKISREYRYRLRETPDNIFTETVKDSIRAALAAASSADALRPILSYVVDAFATHDPGALETLAELIRARRAELELVPDT